MRAKQEFRDRGETEVVVLDTLVDRAEGMTLFELRTHVDVEIDTLETALSSLKSDGLISTEHTGGELVIRPADRVIPDEPTDEPGESIIENILDRFSF